jgi:hypothetical protein
MQAKGMQKNLLSLQIDSINTFTPFNKGAATTAGKRTVNYSKIGVSKPTEDGFRTSIEYNSGSKPIGSRISTSHGTKG